MARLLIFVLTCAAAAYAAVNPLWTYQCSWGVYAAADLGDVDGDGVPDIVCGKYYSDTGDELFALSGRNGAKIWAANDCLGIYGTHGLGAVADLDGDGRREVIMGSPGGVAEGRSFYLKSGATGTTIFSYSTYSGPNDGWVYAVAGTGDVNGNGKADLLAAAGGNTNNRSGTVFCFDGGSTTDAVNILWTFRPPLDGAQCVAPMEDVTGDGVPDVVAGAGGNGYDNRVYGINGATGAKLWEYNTGNSVYDVVVMSDVTGDGKKDVAAGGWAKTVVGLNAATGALLWTRNVNNYVMDLEMIPDVNSDGYDDVVVGAWGSSLWVLSGKDGAVILSQPVAADCWSVDVVNDADGDGQWEAAVGALGGGSGVAGVYDKNGVSLWSHTFAERVYDVETVGDITGDGVNELAVCLQHKGNEAAHVWLFDVVDDTGVDPEPPATPTPRTPFSFSLRAPRPHPCRDVAVIDFTLPVAAPAYLAVFDLAGRRVLDCHAQGRAGDNNLTLDVSSLGPGVYLYRLTAGTDCATRKMIIAR